MKKQEIILNLIQQDLKHNQLIIGLDKLGLEGSDIHNLRILEMVSNLMKVSKSKQTEWSNTYMLCMEESIKYQITNRGDNLKPLAEVSYLKLKEVLDNSNG